MRNKLLVAAYVLSSAVSVVSGCSEVDGNWYCDAVQAIRYSNVGGSGSYNQITDMPPTGNCSFTPKTYAGPIAPLNEEISFHFRGPLQLKLFAAYAPGTTSSKEKREGSTAKRRRHRQHLDKHARAGNKKRDKIYATIDGQLVSWDDISPTPSLNVHDGGAKVVTATINNEIQTWINNWFGPSTSTASTSSVISSATTSFSEPHQSTSKPSSKSQAPTTTSASESKVSASWTTPTAAVASGSYSRIGYYNSAEQILDNLVFLGNYGGQGSGVFDEVYGASLSFVNEKGTGGASSPQILSDTILPSDSEVVVMLGKECNNDCGYVRNGAVAYHGFDGPDKVFLLEFIMPSDESTGFNANMPAVWVLNAQIPRTIQYGNPTCSCWESGCGEFDIAEALNAGSTFLKSTLHTNKPGGASDYLLRPISTSLKLAVVFSSASSTIQIQVLPATYDFPTSLTTDDIQSICSTTTGSKLSEFAIS